MTSTAVTVSVGVDPATAFTAFTSSLMVFKQDARPAPDAPPTHEVWVHVDDLDAHLARVRAGGAEILRGITHTGFRAYTAADLEGHRWTFAQARPRQ